MRLANSSQESLVNIIKSAFHGKLPFGHIQKMIFSYRILFCAALLILTGCTTFPFEPINNEDTDCEINHTNSKYLSHGWLFRTDPSDMGLLYGWNHYIANKEGWVESMPGKPWEASGFDYDGVAWYITEITLPEWPTAYLGFGKVDDSATMWINGTRIDTWTNIGPEAVLIDLTEHGKVDDTLHLSIRIVDYGGFGGIKQPIILGRDPREVMTSVQYTTLLATTHPEWPMPAWSKKEPYSWTMSGNTHVSEEALVSSDGSVAPWAKAPRAEIWIYHLDQRLLTYADPNKIKFSLADSSLPMPTWEWQTADVIVTNTLFGDNNHAAVRWKVTLTNSGTKHITFTMMLSVRPFATNADSAPICNLQSQRNRRMWVNNKPFLVSDTPAKRTGIALLDKTMYAALDGTVPSTNNISTTNNGDLAAVWAYPLDLDPGETTEFHFAFPDSPGSDFPTIDISIDRQINEALAHWKQAIGKVGLTVPDPTVQNGLNASIGYLLLSLDPDGPHPGPLAHDAVWVRDSAYTGLALLQFGHEDSVRTTVTSTFKSQDADGRIPPIRGENTPWQDDEWDSQGQAIFLASEYYRYTNNKTQIRDWYPNIRLAALYISTLMSLNANLDGATKGLLPPSKSAEDLGPADWHHYWDNFWAVVGLKQAAFIATELDQHEDAMWMISEATTLRTAILDSVKVVMGPNPAYIPGAVEGTTSSAMARGTVAALWPHEIIPRNTDLITRSFDTYHKLWIEPDNGGFRHLGGQFWPYGGLELAHAYLRINRTDVMHQILSWTLRNQTLPGTFAWAEQVEPANGSFSGGDMPHAWAAASYATLVREMLISERNDAIELLKGVPEWWLTDGRKIAINNAPTHYGELSLHTSNDIRVTETGWNGTLTMKLSGTSPPNGYHWKLPKQPSVISSASDTKLEDGFLIIPGGSNVIELVFSSQ